MEIGTSRGQAETAAIIQAVLRYFDGEQHADAASPEASILDAFRVYFKEKMDGT
ncbi:MAG: hypothetical protein PHG91_04390 [Syntrophales bacterium]|nr:hypothetical protein [Syntrophales bacterium]MDD5232614.1 hypothetical protein [Syntrophales bacterium]MDD5533472.1 hypothetical protein [Syntrophales bacterium]HPL62170.1 hypothetical protein [Syntrophales bacterium]